MYNLMFSTPALENRFRTLVHENEHEVGGFFVINTYPEMWSGKFSWRKTKKALSQLTDNSTWFIDHVIVLPNLSEHPHREFEWGDFQREYDIAGATAGLYLGMPLPFHSHPHGHPGTPSESDIEFAISCCQIWRGEAMFAIVTDSPLRVHPYELKIRTVGAPGSKPRRELYCGEFFSWRRRALRALRGE